MGTGPYNNNQNTPPLMSSFEQAELGWLNYTPLNSKTNSVVKIPSLDSIPMGMKISVPGKPNEYFIVENRQQTGWDTYLPGHGLLVWHVDMDSTAWATNRVNADPQHQHLKLVEADGTPDSDAGDPFPGSRDITSYDFKSWDEDNIFGFAYIDEPGDGNVKFILSGSDYKPAMPSDLSVNNILGHTAIASWLPVADATKYEVAVTEGEDTIYHTTVVDTTAVTLRGLSPQTGYQVNVKASYGPFFSDNAQKEFTTTEEQYQEKSITATTATNVSDDSFTANWLPLAGTQYYHVDLFQNLFTGSSVSAWDFTDKAEGKPQGWETSSTRYDNNNYGNAAPGLRLSKDGEYIKMSQTNGKIQRLSLWYKASTSGNTITIENYKNGSWEKISDIELVKDAANTLSIDIDNADSLKVVYHRNGAGYVTLDDIAIEYSFEQLHKVDSATVSEGCSRTFNGLDSGNTYTYVVYGINGNEISLCSNPVRVTLSGVNSIKTLVPDRDKNCKDRMYNTIGQRVGTGYKGLVISRNKKYIVK